MHKTRLLIRGMVLALLLLTVTPTLAAAATAPTRVCLALGAGGANGLAHVPVLEVIDEFGITPHRIAGSSIGSIIGALYAAGLSGVEIRRAIDRFVISGDESTLDEIRRRGSLRWIEFIDIELGRCGLLSSDGFIAFMYDTVGERRFEDLAIPLRVVAADLWRREQVVLEAGPLLPAIKASMALPGVFEPEIIDDRVLVDGGIVNPVPFDVLGEDCQLVIAVDVAGIRSGPDDRPPGYFDTLFNAVKVMQRAILDGKLRDGRPDIVLAPGITDVRALEFYKAEDIFRQSGAAADELRAELQRLIESGRLTATVNAAR